MVALWGGFDELAGKGVDMGFVLKFIGYLALTVVPMAMPIGILLSSIMAVGNLSENYEFAAMKSAGISLRRFMLPLVILAFLLSSINFLFLNYVYPHATLKQKNMYLNVKKKQPALALIPGTFNTAIPGYVIYFEEKYGENQNLLHKVQISDISDNQGKIKVITAKRGEIFTEEGSKYLTFNLFDGNYFEEHSTKKDKKATRIKMPGSKATFDIYSINIDVSAFGNDGIEDTKLKTHPQMLSLKQLQQHSDTTKIEYDKYLISRNVSILRGSQIKELKPATDSVHSEKLNPEILENFEIRDRALVYENAINNIDREITSLGRTRTQFKSKRKFLNLFDMEYHYRLAFALACLVLFFIGAPLGSIIRKGGFGLPMVLAIIIFVIYHVLSTIGKNLAEESAVSAALGGWLATLILLPFGILLTRRAARDKGIFNFKTFISGIAAKTKQLSKKKKDI
ncbi:LptF/LptG family permease [Urechidicola sp. KH5]